MSKKFAQPKIPLRLWLESDLRVRLDLMLFSDLEGRVPHGDYTRFFGRLLREYLDWEQLDMTAYGFPAGYFVKGPKEMVQKMRERLEAIERVFP